MNILILSCGRRNKIVQYFKNAVGAGQVFAADCDALAPALYEAHHPFIIPRMDSPDYLDSVLEICETNKVNAVLSLIDPELSILAANANKFERIGTTPLVSAVETVELCLDKFRFYNYLRENSFPTVKTYIDRDAFAAAIESGCISYPVMVKPVKGSASMNVTRVCTPQELAVLISKHRDLIIQEYIEGKEYGADVYVDLISGETTAVFLKEKIKMRAGETDKSVSLKDERLFSLITELTGKLRFRGVIDVDLFRVGSKYLISEINPRFGGGYPHAHECGVDMASMIINNLRGQTNSVAIGHYTAGSYMMKYSELKVISSAKLHTNQGNRLC